MENKEINSYIKFMLESYEDDLNNQVFDNIYEDWEFSIPVLTKLLMEVCDPLETLGYVPEHYAYCLKEITEAVLNDNIVTIGNSAFDNCLNLEKVVIPNSVEHIGREAFRNCPKLKEIIYQGTSEEFKNIYLYKNSFNANVIIVTTDARTRFEEFFNV